MTEQLKLLVYGVDCKMTVINSFCLMNCYTCFNESSNNFNLRSPTIKECLPFDETIGEDDLGDVYDYYT